MSRPPAVPLAAPSLRGCEGAGADGPVAGGVGVRIEPLMPAGRLDRPEGVGGKAACAPGIEGLTAAMAMPAGGREGWLGAGVAAAAGEAEEAGAGVEEGGVFERAGLPPLASGVLTAVAAGAGAAGASSFAPQPRQNL
jgi:hypothetical protein